MKYVVSIGGREIDVEVDGDQVTVDGETVTAVLRTVPGTPIRHLALGDRGLTLALERAGRGQWAATAGGIRWEAEVLDERTRHIRSLAAAAAGPARPGVLRAPMPGLVVRIPVEPGQAVAAGAGVVTLEAMKMENELKATVAGTVKQVLVRPGQAVEKGQPLIEFE